MKPTLATTSISSCNAESNAKITATNLVGFVKNIGQIDSVNSNIRYYISTGSGKIYFFDNFISFVSYKTNKSYVDKLYSADISIQRTDLLLGEFSESTSEVIGEEVIYSLNYYQKKKEFRSPVFKVIKYKNSKTGSVLTFEISDKKRLKMHYLKGANSEASIEFIIKGSDSLAISQSEIKTVTSAGDIVFTFSDKADLLVSSQKSSASDLNFSLTSKARSGDLMWATFMGGAALDELYGIDTNDSCIIVSGYTLSEYFPTTTGVLQEIKDVDYDAVISKFSLTGNIEWSTFYGGSSLDFAYKSKYDFQGNIILTGYSSSSNLNVSSNAWQDTLAGSYDAFILKLNPLGQIIWSSYFGGTGADIALTMDVDASGNVLISGYTISTDLPITSASYQNMLAGARDAFIAKFSSEGTLLYSTYLGGTGSEDAHVIGVDDAGNILVTGDTYSSDFPVTSGAYQSYNAGSSDAYITKFNSMGGILWSTYFGGTSSEDPAGLTIDENLNIYISGFTNSNDFYIEGNSFQTIKSGIEDGFIVKLNSFGSLIWSSYFGGNNDDRLLEIKLHNKKYLFVCGITNSSTYPVTANAFQSMNSGNYDATICVFDTAGNLHYSSYFGGSEDDRAMDIAVSVDHKVFITGFTYSADFPTLGAFQNIYGNDGDGFIAGFNASNWASFDNPTGNTLIESTSDFQLILYPNPATDYIFMDLPFISDKTSFEIIDNSGRIQLKGILNDYSKGIFIKELGSGLYYLKIRFKNGHLVYSAPFYIL